MIKCKIKIKNVTGLHLRPAGILCNEAVKYKSKILFYHDNLETNAKSVLSLLGASIRYGDKLELCIDGEDEQIAMRNIVDLINSGLGE